MSATFAEQLSAWSTFATAAATLVLVIAAFQAWHTAKHALEASKDANVQARRDSIEQTRPYVFVEILPGLAGVGAFDIRISNSGKSSARNLTLDYDAWPDGPDNVNMAVRGLFETPRTLPPGTSLRAMWRLTSGEAGQFTDSTTETGLGTSGAITVHYTSSDPSKPQYTERFDVLIDNSGLWPVPEDGNEPNGEMQGKALQFYKLAQVLVRRIGELDR